jgi:hypothetical protein
MSRTTNRAVLAERDAGDLFTVRVKAVAVLVKAVAVLLKTVVPLASVLYVVLR